MAKIQVYTMAHCPYCIRAKALLKRRMVEFDEILVPDENEAQWEELFRRSGMKTMPQIFAGDKLIGGFSELAELDEKDSLVSLR